MYKIFENKKGIGVDDFIPLVVVMSAFIVALLVFGIASVARKKLINEDISDSIKKIDGDYNLIHFLRTPTNDNENIADLVMESYLNDDFQELNIKASSYFDEVYGYGKWNLELSFAGETIRKFGMRRITTGPTMPKIKLASISLPAINSDILTLELFILR